MQLVSNTIACTVDELHELMRHIVSRELSGQINITFKHDGIQVWQPSRMPAPDDIGQGSSHPYDFHNQIKKDE